MPLKASYRRTKTERWEGVLKQDGKVIWACGHNHECRDNNHSRLYAHLGAAMKCASDELRRRQPAPQWKRPAPTGRATSPEGWW